ncbi:hypothetical protein Taro_047360 [Colocasia esculenta]|uniref:Aminotransferase-like plant mobile domain-containing protein n=1 Tax=Colocasia esculenta TaxID=4460 RepID=A0A843WVZ5_COLES|nr:hypothetical protein [Colocasia esculenta]
MDTNKEGKQKFLNVGSTIGAWVDGQLTPAFDKTGNSVPPMYLLLLEDFNRAGRYSWGSATLAYLYRQLSIACKSDAKAICGSLTLLQLWSWEQLHVGRLDIAMHPLAQNMPLGHRCMFQIQYLNSLCNDPTSRTPAKDPRRSCRHPRIRRSGMIKKEGAALKGHTSRTCKKATLNSRSQLTLLARHGATNRHHDRPTTNSCDSESLPEESRGVSLANKAQ